MTLQTATGRAHVLLTLLWLLRSDARTVVARAEVLVAQLGACTCNGEAGVIELALMCSQRRHFEGWYKFEQTLTPGVVFWVVTMKECERRGLVMMPRQTLSSFVLCLALLPICI